MSCGSGECSSGGCEGSEGCGSSRKGTGACPSMHDHDWFSDMGAETPQSTFPVMEVSFKGGRRGFYRIAQGLDVQTGDSVIVEADRGIDFGTIHLAGDMVAVRLRSKGLEAEGDYLAVVRRATVADLEQMDAIRERDTESFLVGRRTIDRMNLAMKLVDVEWQFDGRKVTFYFTAEQRVDFRELVRKLARRFRTRVELRQIGARDEAARLGGIGSCGRELCCSTWLQEFRPVSTQAAKTQNLPLNPVRLSGQCGRLKCCLNYELEQYSEALRYFPAEGTPVPLPAGVALVRRVDIFRDRVTLSMPHGPNEEHGVLQVREWLGLSGDEPASRLAKEASQRRSGGRRAHD